MEVKKIGLIKKEHKTSQINIKILHIIYLEIVGI